MEQPISYHVNQLHQMRRNMDVLVKKPNKHEFMLAEIAIKHRKLRKQIEDAMLEGLESFNSDTYKQETLI